MKNRIIGFLAQNWANLIVFVLCFLGGVVILSSYWITKHFEVSDFGQILFHLRFPLLGNGVPLVGSYLISVVLASAIIAFCIAWMQLTAKILSKFYSCCVRAFDRFGNGKTKAFKIVLSLALFVLCVNVVVNRFKIKDYLHTQTQYSQLYENHYKPFDSANLAGFTPKQNLIVILVESLETHLAAYTSENMGGGESLNLTPRLQKIANENVNFSISDDFGGIKQVFGTSGTINGTTSYLCGIPLNLPIHINTFESNKYFLSGATCISDILNDLGYKQAYFGSQDAKFAGTENLLKTHKIEVLDSKYFESKRILPKKLPPSMKGAWGAKDNVIFGFAKDYLNTTNEPFALYISTLDTHGPQGFVDKEQCPNLDNSYKSAYLCTDKVVSDFIDYLQNSRFKDNTTIVVLGDHLSSAYFIKAPIISRSVYNAFINAKWTKTPTRKLIKRRVISHFDIAPLILDSLGIRAESFGLGRNPLYRQTLIESAYNIDNFNASLKLRNKIYDSLWDAK